MQMMVEPNGCTIAKLQQRNLSYMETGPETRAETEQGLGPVQARARLEPEASNGIIGGYGGSSEGAGVVSARMIVATAVATAAVACR